MRRRSVLASLLLPAVPARAQARLAAPFDATAIRAAATRPAAAQACLSVPDPVHSLELPRFYTDAAATIADPALLAAENAAAKPLGDWLQAVQRGAEDWLRGGAPAAAGCALASLDAWARDGALLGTFNNQGAYRRKWTLAGAAIATLAIRDAPGLDAAAMSRVTGWLGAVARRVQPPYGRIRPGGALTSTRNNHATWAGLAVAAAGVAAGDRTLLDWGIARLSLTLAEVDADGALPQEVRRGKMALNYHLFTLRALAPLLRIAEANGHAMRPEEDAALGRLVAFTVASMVDPGRMAAIAGVPQGHLTEDPRFDDRTRYARAAQGLEALQGRRPDPALEPLLAAHRPFRAPWMGGNVSLLWGPRAAASR
ncbi:alginate lyase family protein [Roseomonas sp. HF4]|uniref:alginate lyase family protein n=1 Tax=Roseomonas sp. HF4 TaxID=2562313 RepID=UPI0010C13C93|nr:alginate lyase family protein [Roseomonas sp. HF4]